MFTNLVLKPKLASKILIFSARPFSKNFKIRFDTDHKEKKASAPVTKLTILRKLNPKYLNDLPFDFEGTHAVPKLPKRDLVELYLNHKMIDEEFLIDKFHDMVVDLYSALAKGDLARVKSLTEKRFGSKIEKASINIKKQGIKFIPHEIPHIERPLEEQSYIFDKIFEKGMYFDREKNDNNYDYFLDSENEPEGIRYYQHKYFAGYDTHYYLEKYADQKEDRSAKYRFKYFAEQRNRSIVLRVYGVFRNLGIFTSKSNQALQSPDYTGNHLVIFENQLKEPPVIALTNPNIETWIMKHKINHNHWRITDIDNYMKGKYK